MEARHNAVALALICLSVTLVVSSLMDLFV